MNSTSTVDFTSDFFITNRARLRELASNDAPIIVTANGLLQKSADNPYSFHQDSNFWYLTGIAEPDLVLVLDGAEEYLLVPRRSRSREAFDGAVDYKELKRISGVEDIIGQDEGWKRLAHRIKTKKKVQTLAAPDGYIESYGMYTNPARARLIEHLHSGQPNVEIEDIRNHLAQLRCVKQPLELAAIQKAIDVTIVGLKEIIYPANLLTYEYEYEIEADLHRAFRRSGAKGHAFDPIVSGGIRACTFHNVSNQSKLEKNELVVMDVGAEFNHYAADMTRTVALQKPTKRQQEVFDAVLDVQSYGISLFKPGISFKECEIQLRKYMGKKLKELGLIDQAGDKQGIAKYYPHAPHYLGLDVHDVGDYTKPLEPGMVLTCEPGIYIPEEGIGIRIEDDILITINGNKVLSAALPSVLSANA